ncbi:tripartite tricarboxylate transporter substrate binding protein [Williamsia phyllosphaerae]|uniref:C4-dicarboxylate ABC transporter substrate-binding protein n=1 Tax=Williamsia phyllosphaerae TaxID=885042 RepID=A0ABQ1VAC0_9NOCA|nr:tripartite tricarboxylate transporter substrate-binding protein [Williamsia phyllosphaerae]GGF43450.1 C4-dicarboxylate ABC transporter substrate-binding protein [Williamsia phyllosphaerae]
MRLTTALAALAATVLVMAGCADSDSRQPDSATAYPSGPVTMSAGAGPGSGFDLTIRAVVDALRADKIVTVGLPVQNKPGGAGADLLATMVRDHRGADDQIAVTSLSMMLNQLEGRSPYGYADVTMIARLMTEYFVVVTGSASPSANLGEVMAAIKADPSSVRVGAAADDQAPFDLLVSATGGDPSKVRYIDVEGGADQTAALRNDTVDVAIGGVSEFAGAVRDRTLRALGVLAENRVPGLDAPTAREQGLDVTLSNWRGLYGPPDMPASAVDYWRNALGDMVKSPAWIAIAQRSQFTTTFSTGDDLQKFLANTQSDVKTALDAQK